MIAMICKIIAEIIYAKSCSNNYCKYSLICGLSNAPVELNKLR